MPADVWDSVVIGAGPVGLACAIEAAREGLRPLVVEKGALVNSIVGYPARMEFFSTPELIEIGAHPFPVQGYKPTREEALEYYRGVAVRERLDIRLYERVLEVRGTREDFTIVTTRGEHRGRSVIVAIGFFDIPNLLNVPGETLPKVSHYYTEPYPYVGQKVVIVGARNSAAKAALDLYRHGAEVTLVAREAALSDKVKYWIKPDLENRIAEGSVRALYGSVVQEIRERSIVVRTPAGVEELANDWVLAMTGYRPDYGFLESLGVAIGGDACRTPVYDEATFETSRSGVYVAGTVCGGLCTGRWFIENGRHHARQIAKHLARGTAEPVPFDRIHWKTAE